MLAMTGGGFCHCEERSDVAIHDSEQSSALDVNPGLLRYARKDWTRLHIIKGNFLPKTFVSS